MERVNVGRYSDPKAVGFAGWIETSDWIAFTGLDGRLTLFVGRDADTGGVTGPGVVVQPIG